MESIEEFVDERNKGWCIHCGGSIAALDTNSDHVPSKSLLRKPHPAYLPQVQVCMDCNSGFSRDEEYLALFLQCVLVGSTDPDRHGDPKVIRALERNPKLRARIEASRTEYGTADGERRTVWKPEVERINRIILKNARGHAFYEYGEPMLAEPAFLWSAPLEMMTAAERTEFEDIRAGRVLPEVGSRMLTRVITGQDLSNGWVVVQDGVYRYCVAQVGVMLVSVRP